MTSQIDAWVQQYTRWSEEQIRAVMIKHELHTQLVRVVRGPLTLTFQIALLPQSVDKQSLAKLMKLDEVIGVATRSSDARVYKGESGLINIELPLPAQAGTTPPAAALVKLTQGPNLCMGINSLRQPVNIDIRQHGAVLWVGPSRSGKTQSIKSTLYTLLTQPKLDMRFIIIAQKLEDWEELRDLRQCWGIASSLDEIQAASTWAQDELERRTLSKVKRPLIVIIADDMINLVEADPTIGKKMGAIASQGAGMGINLFIGTQEAGSKRGTGDNSVENNTTARMVYRIANTQAASRSAGQGGAGVDKLSGRKGDALFILHGVTHRVATGYVPAGAFDALPMGAEKAPWLDLIGAREDEKKVVAPVVAPHNHRNQSQPATTTHNRLQPVVVGGEGMWYAEKNGDTRREIIHPSTTTPGATTSATTPTAVVATTAEVGAATEKQSQARPDWMEAVPAEASQGIAQPQPQPVTFPIKRRSLTAAEKEEVRRMRAEGMSERKICFAVYGHRDGTTVGWVKEALEGFEPEPNNVVLPQPKAQPQAQPAQPDLSTLDDQAILQLLLDKKAINWDATVNFNRQTRIGAGG